MTPEELQSIDEPTSEDSPPVVVHVEDSDEVARAVADCLAAARYRVERISRVEDLASVLSRVQVRAVLLDLALLGASGDDAVRMARAVAPRVVLLVVTSRAIDPGDRARYRALGADGVHAVGAARWLADAIEEARAMRAEHGRGMLLTTLAAQHSATLAALDILAQGQRAVVAEISAARGDSPIGMARMLGRWLAAEGPDRAQRWVAVALSAFAAAAVAAAALGADVDLSVLGGDR